MKKFWLIFGILAVLLIAVLIVFFFVGFFRPKAAGISVTTTPAAAVFIDGTEVGRTPYDGTRDPGEVTLKLVPESESSPLSPFETKVTLSSGIKTVIKREFGSSDEVSSGEIISFEKMGGSDASLAVISIPDAAQISIDGAVRGFSPYKSSSILAGEHQLIVSAQGYSPRTLSVKTIVGYKLTAFVKLAKSGEEASPTPAPSQISEKQTLILILSTPTGFLRVRSQAGTGGVEVGQIKPGQKFPFIDEDTATGWFKIEYEKGKNGWVSSK